MGRTFASVATLLLLARCIAPFPAAADAPREDKPLPVVKLAGPSGLMVAFTRDGSRIVTANSDSAQVWDAETFQPVGEPVRNDGGLVAAKVSDRGDVLLTVGNDVRAWDMRTANMIGQPLGSPWHEDDWGGYAISPDGSRAAVTKAVRDGDRTVAWDVEVWQLEPRRRLRQLRHTKRTDFALFSPDGTRLLTGELIQRGVHLPGGEVFHLWHIESGSELIAPVGTQFNGNSDDGPPGAFSPDGTRLVLAGLETFLLYDGHSGKPVSENRVPPRHTFSGARLKSVSFSADGRLILTEGGGVVELWSATNAAQIGPTYTGHLAAITPDGNRLVTVHETGIRKGDPPARAQVVFHDAATGQVQYVIDTEPIDVIAISPDGRRVAAGFASKDFTTDGCTAIWEVPTGTAP